MSKVKLISSVIGIIVLLVLTSMTLQWTFEKEYTSLHKDGDLIARYRWSVEAERTYIVKDSWYDRNVKCPRIIDDGGYETATRCYYPDDYYEQLSRSLINTKISYVNTTVGVDVNRLTPFYKYGTSGAYAGKVDETSVFVDTDVPEEFPIEYNVNWAPSDTRNYQLIWRIWELDEMDLPEGEYYDCEYIFGAIKIDLTKECDKLDKVVVKDDKTVWVYFDAEKGYQSLDVNLVDPLWVGINLEITEPLNITYDAKTMDIKWNMSNLSDISSAWYFNRTDNITFGPIYDKLGTANGARVAYNNNSIFVLGTDQYIRKYDRNNFSLVATSTVTTGSANTISANDYFVAVDGPTYFYRTYYEDDLDYINACNTGNTNHQGLDVWVDPDVNQYWGASTNGYIIHASYGCSYSSGKIYAADVGSAHWTAIDGNSEWVFFTGTGAEGMMRVNKTSHANEKPWDFGGTDVVTDDNYVYWGATSGNATFTDKIVVMDISDNFNIINWSIPYNGKHLSLDDNYLYVPNGTMIDTYNKTDFTLVESNNLTVSYAEVRGLDGWLYGDDYVYRKWFGSERDYEHQEDGQYTLYVYVNNSEGNETSANVTYTIDTFHPNITYPNHDTKVGVTSIPVRYDLGINNLNDPDSVWYEINSTYNVTFNTFETGTAVGNCEDLQNMNENLSDTYYLVSDIDCSDTINWNDGKGFIPIGTYAAGFNGTLDGNNHVITDMYQGWGGTYPDQGLFGYIYSATIRNVGIENLYQAASSSNAGGIAGHIGGDVLIDNVYVFNSSIYGSDSGGIGGCLSAASTCGTPSGSRTNITNSYVKDISILNVGDNGALFGYVNFDHSGDMNYFINLYSTGESYTGNNPQYGIVETFGTGNPLRFINVFAAHKATVKGVMEKSWATGGQLACTNVWWDINKTGQTVGGDGTCLNLQGIISNDDTYWDNESVYIYSGKNSTGYQVTDEVWNLTDKWHIEETQFPILTDYRIFLEDGYYNITLWANSSLYERINTSYNVLIDSIWPNMVVNSPLDEEVYQDLEVLINISVDDAGIDLWWNNGTDNLTYTSAENYTFATGPHQLSFYADDVAGHFESEDRTIYINPEIEATIVSPANNSIITDEFPLLRATSHELTGMPFTYDAMWYNIDGGNNISMNPVTTGTPIYNCEDWDNIRNNLNDDVYLVQDIDCEGETFITIQSNFYGDIYGNGHTINGLKLQSWASNTGASAHFYKMYGDIYDIGFRNITVYTWQDVQSNAVVAYYSYGNMDRVFVDGVYFESGSSTTRGIAGLAFSIGPSSVVNNSWVKDMTQEVTQQSYPSCPLVCRGINSNGAELHNSYATNWQVWDDRYTYMCDWYLDMYNSWTDSGTKIYKEDSSCDYGVYIDDTEEFYNMSHPVYDTWDFESTWYQPYVNDSLPFLHSTVRANLSEYFGTHNITYCANTTYEEDCTTNYVTTQPAPVITWVSPVDGGKYNVENVPINISSNPSVVNIWWYNGTVNLTYSGATTHPYPEGESSIQAWANDSLGNVVTIPSTFTVDFTEPIVSFVDPTPANNTVMNFAENFINATVTELNIDTISLFWQQPTSQDEFNDSTQAGNLTWSGTETFVKYMEIPAEATVGQAYLNLSGLHQGNFANRDQYIAYTSADLDTDIYGTTWVGQTFKNTGGTHLPASIYLWGLRSGSPETMDISLFATNATGHPIGSAMLTGTYNASTLTTNPAGEFFEVQFPDNEYVMQNDTTYFISISAPDGGFSDKLIIKYDSTGTYTDGSLFVSSNSGSDWTAQSSADAAFRYYGTDMLYATDSIMEIGDFGGAYEWSYLGGFNTTETTDNLASDINTALNGGACDCDECSLSGAICTIPFSFYSTGYGKIEYSAIDIEYSWGEAFTEYPMECTEVSLGEHVCNTTIYNSSFGVSYNFYVFANDTFGLNSTTDTWTLLDDTNAPQYYNKTEDPVNGSLFTGGTYIFNITILEQNLDECNVTWEGSTMPIDINTYRFPYYDLGFTRPPLSPGEYEYTWNCWDSPGHVNSTTYYYTVSKGQSDIVLNLNSSVQNMTIDQGESVLIDVTVSAGEGDVELYLDGTLINSGTAPLTNTTSFPEAGIFNITAIHPETTNYQTDVEVLWVTVLDTTDPYVEVISPDNGTITNILYHDFTLNITDNYGVQNATFFIYDDIVKEKEETITYFGVGNTSFIQTFNHTLSDEVEYTWWVDIVDTEGNTNSTPVNSLTLEYFPLATLNSPESGHFVSRPDPADFNVTLNVTVTDETPDQINVSFWDNNTEEIIVGADGNPCVFLNVANGSSVACEWNKSFAGEIYVEKWFVQMTDGKRETNSTEWNFTVKDVKVKDIDIYPIGATTSTVSWNNEPEIEWTALYVYDEEGFLVGNEYKAGNGSASVEFTGLEPNTLHTLIWQTGYSFLQSRPYNTTFKTKGWADDYTDWEYRRVITLDSSQVSADTDDEAWNITLDQTNFYHGTVINAEWWVFGQETDFYKMNSDASDIRITNYRDTEKIPFNITYVNIYNDGNYQYQEVPNATTHEGTWLNPSYCDDSDWATRCEPDSTVNNITTYYFNYTIPDNVSTQSRLRVQSGAGLDIIPNSVCWGGTDLEFKTVHDMNGYYGPTTDLYCRNQGTGAWQYDWISTWGAGVTLYETRMQWEYDSKVILTVMPEYFSDDFQLWVNGTNGEVDGQLYLYYGNDAATDASSNFTYTSIQNGGVTVGSDESYVPPAPIITNINDSLGRTPTGTNITWDTDILVNHRLILADNMWYLGDGYVNATANESIRFENYAGTIDTQIETNIKVDDYAAFISMECSNASYNNNYSIDTSGEYVLVNLDDVDDSALLNWTLNYTDLHTWQMDTDEPNFKIENLDANITYYYTVYSKGDGSATTEMGTFIIGTPYADIPASNIYDYDEQRQHSNVTIFGNLTNLSSSGNVNVSIQYWNEMSTEFNETPDMELTSLGTFAFNITVDYGYTYNYRIKAVGAETSYSDIYTNEYMEEQQFFAGNYVEDDLDYLTREYCPNLPLNRDGCVNQTGVREGSAQTEDWIWIESSLQDFGALTVVWWNGTNFTEYPMGDNGDINYLKLTNLGEEWQTFYIKNSTDDTVLEWTKPTLLRNLTGLRADEIKYVSFGQEQRPINYTTLYMDYEDFTPTATAYCEANGGDVFQCMSTSMWATGDVTGPEMGGYESDRGRLFSGGSANGGAVDTGKWADEPVQYEYTVNLSCDCGDSNSTGRYCYAFTIYYWDRKDWTPSNNITNYYYRYWAQTQWLSEFYGVTEDRVFDYTCIKAFDDESGSWGRYTYDQPTSKYGADQCHPGTAKFTENAIQSQPAGTWDSPYNQTLFQGFQDGFQVDTSDDMIYNIVQYFDTTHVNQMFNKHQQAFVIWNLPDNATLLALDSDNDGLNDHEELFTYYTNPNSNDTDGGGISDGVEILYVGTDPNLYFDEETEAPKFNEFQVSPANNTQYISITEYEFRANITDTNLNTTNIIVDFNGTNYTAYLDVDGFWEINFTGLQSGTYYYQWFAEDSYLNRNASEVFDYTIGPQIAYAANVTLNPDISFEFFPENSTHKGVEPVRQSATNWTVRIHNNQTYDARGIILLAEEYDTSWGGDIKLKVSDTYDYSTAITVTEDFYFVSPSQAVIPAGSSDEIYFWADYYVAQREWYPDLEVMIQKVD